MWHQVSGSDHPTLGGGRAHLLSFVPAPWTRAKQLAVSEEGPQGPAMLSERLAAQLGLPEHQRLPYTNTRLVLASEVTDDDYFFGGTVVRCWVDPHSHPAVRQTLQGLEFRCAEAFSGACRPAAAPGCRPTARLSRPCVSWPLCRRVSLGALAVQAIVNKRGEPHARLPAGAARLPAARRCLQEAPARRLRSTLMLRPSCPCSQGLMALWESSPARRSTAPGAQAAGERCSSCYWRESTRGACRRFGGCRRSPGNCTAVCATRSDPCASAVGTVNWQHLLLQHLSAARAQQSAPKCAPDARRTFLRSSMRRLLQLCQQCHDNGEVLACTLPSADVVLVPRLPGTAAQVWRAAGLAAGLAAVWLLWLPPLAAAHATVHATCPLLQPGVPSPACLAGRPVLPSLCHLLARRGALRAAAPGVQGGCGAGPRWVLSGGCMLLLLLRRLQLPAGRPCPAVLCSSRWA